MQSLDVISVNLWQIIISLLNLIILFLGVKKFLYKPVCSMMAKMQAEVDEKYADAENARKKAMEDEALWNDKIRSAKQEADEIIADASQSAKSKGERIVADAKEKAEGIVRQAEVQAQLEMKKAEDEIKKEIVDVSYLLTEKMLEREINADDHKNMIDSFIEKLGEEND